MVLTNGAASMGSNKVGSCLRDGTHTDLVKSTGKEGSKSWAEDNVTIPAGQSDPHATDVLFSNEALDIAVIESFLVGQREGGVLCVSIQSNDPVVVLAKFY